MEQENKKTILVVEDEEKLRKTVADFLALYEYNVIEAKDGEVAISQFEKYINEIDLILLDIMLPVTDGQEVLKQIREVSEVPVIMMTAKSGDYEQIKSFGNGVDDYIKKPFMLAVLKARIEAVLKRVGKNERLKEITVGKIRLECSSRKLYINGEYIVTTPKEFELLCYLAENQNRVVSRDELLDKLWDWRADVETRTLDIHIKTLRQKLGEEAGHYIKTVRSVGYRFMKPQE